MAQLELRRTVTQLENSIDDLRGYEDLLEKYQRSLEASFATVAAESITDSLTDLKNRRAFEVQLESEHLRSERYGTELALAILDLDQFKSFNDTFGHPVGDDVSRTVARLLEAGACTTDFVARFGGEEFVVLFPNTSVDAAHVIAERLRKSLDVHQWEHRDVTVSIGVAGWSADLAGPEDLVALADRALYRAKQEGRNRVIAAAAVAENTTRSPITLVPSVDHDRLGTEAEPEELTRVADGSGISFVFDDTASREREAPHSVDRDEAGV